MNLNSTQTGRVMTMRGFNELIGVKLEMSDFVSRSLTDMIRQLGYQQISIPIIEMASSFSEEVVGESPWPGFNEEGCFQFDMHDYDQSYDKISSTHKVLLVPEGTTSVTRWLGSSLDNKSVSLPIRVFYHVKCFRNELISALSKTKGREFTQFGSEIMGDDSIMAEVETVRVIVDALECLGIERDAIHVRFNDITIYNQLIAESGIESRRVAIKEHLDALAGVKAGKRPERYDLLIESLDTELQHLDRKVRSKWDAIIFQEGYSVSEAAEVFGNEYADKFRALVDIQLAFSTCGIQIDLDLCVIRSHEYYTSMSFEVDVVGRNDKYAEVAGGGRYDRLVGNFIHSVDSPRVIPCVGFAFGVERLIELLDKEGAFQKSATLASKFDFSHDAVGGYEDETMSRIRDILAP